MSVNLTVAFAAGILGFFSPCVVPLIPGYISFVSVVSLWDLRPAERREHLSRVLLATIAFVFGFSLIFTALGASASYLGAFVIGNRLLLSRIGGVIVILLGLTMLGMIRIPGLARERRVQIARRPGGLLGAFPIGMAFGFAWTPLCRAGAGRDPHAGGDHTTRCGRRDPPLRLLAGARDPVSRHRGPPHDGV